MLHSPLSPTKNPSGQIHAMVRVGKVSWTTHSCPAIHGLFTRQGFWQRSLIQACCEGQFSSILHSGSTGTFARNYKILFISTNISKFYEISKTIILEKQLTFIACCIAIPNKWRIASTYFLVVLGCTRCTLGARIASTEWHAFFSTTTRCSKITFLSWRTIIVRLTTHFLTTYHRVSLKTGWAETDCFMPLWPTFSPATTDETITRIRAFLVVTSLVKWAIVINQAFVFEALLIWITSPTTWTAAYWSVRRCLTQSFFSTWV